MAAWRFNSLHKSCMQAVDRAILDLRRGIPVVLQTADGPFLVAPLEGLNSELLADMIHGSAEQALLLLTQRRLNYLGQDQSQTPAALPLTSRDSLNTVIRWAVAPQASWPQARRPHSLPNISAHVMMLLRRGLLIPSAVITRPNQALRADIESALQARTLIAITPEEIDRHQHNTTSLLQRVSEANVPLEVAASSRFIVFREADGLREHVAILIGEPANWPACVPVRLHSACLTGDLFGSLRCDCGAQLKTSVATINQRGGGILLYLDQEGRSIGFANKMRAYQMQDEGLDTIDADHVLGFSQDERHYAVAREMLIDLEVEHIDLLTNNPTKLAALDHPPLRVEKRSRIYGHITRHNRNYLYTKSQRAGHWLDQLLDTDDTDSEPDT